MPDLVSFTPPIYSGWRPLKKVTPMQSSLCRWKDCGRWNPVHHRTRS